MKKLLFIIFVFALCNVQGQVTQVSLQASGLTCSMCSNAINKSLKTIDYVENVRANIQQSSFDISFKEGATIDFDELKLKVEAAGFSVANLTASVNFGEVSVSNDKHVILSGQVFHFLNVKQQKISGVQKVRILDKGFVSSKEFKKNARFTKMECYTTGVAGACCSKEGLSAGKRIYHVTI